MGVKNGGRGLACTRPVGTEGGYKLGPAKGQFEQWVSIVHQHGNVV